MALRHGQNLLADVGALLVTKICDISLRTVLYMLVSYAHYFYESNLQVLAI